MATANPIQRSDIETKLRELRAELTPSTGSSASLVLTVGLAGAVVLVGVAYLLGRRRGTKRSTVVEIRRI